MIKKYYLLYLLICCAVTFGYGQVLSDDCSILTGTWTFNSVTQNSGYWLLDNNSDYVISEPFGAYDNLVLTSNLRSFGGGGDPDCTIEISDDGGSTWTAGSITYTSLANSYLNYVYNIGTLAGTNNRIRWRRSAGVEGLRVNTITLTGTTIGAGSNDSDIIAVASSESATISSTINDTVPLTITDGMQVWQFTIRDGGASSPDSDNLSTILTDLTFAQGTGNQVTTWTDAIETIALFDGSTFIATGTVIANQIQFTGMNVDVADDTQTTLTVRLSLQCPLGADAFDNEDFVFSLSNANTTFSSSGSGKATFSAITSANGENRIDIAASELEFTSQPTTTGINAPMNDVVVSALDACGNIDTDFSGTVSLTSTGTMTGSPLMMSMSSGEVTFVGIVHTAVATNRTMTASATGVSNIISSTFDITNVTTLNPGDLAILAVNTDYDSSGSISGDRISFVIFKDITVNTEIYLTDNGYERRYTDRWGSSEGVIRIRRTGSTLPAGSIITIEATNSGNITSGSHYDVYTCGVVDTNWNKWALSGSGIGGFNMNNNDDIWIMQGGAWTNSINTTGQGSACTGIATDTWQNSQYSGTVLYGWTESGWDATAGGCSGDTRWSSLYPTLECFNTVAPLSSGKVKFDDPINPDFSTTTNGRIDWIALINDEVNWNTYASNTDYDNAALGYDYKLNTTCSAVIIATTGYVNGKWTGREDSNWFYCANWDTFAVPDETVDVLIEDHPTYNNHANVDATATYANNYGNIAKSRNLTITGEKVEISGSINNILEVHGNLLIDNTSTGSIDMDDGNAGTADGQLFITGNWTNGRSETAFNEGNGTVIFNGIAIQSIAYGGPPIPPGPLESEIFYNVILDNDFDIGFGDRTLYINGDLTINSSRSLTVQSNQYVYVGNIVTNLGDFTLEDSASLVQFNDVNNVGNLTVKRNSYVETYDYVYWSSPVSGFNTDDLFTSSSTYIYSWDPTMNNIPFGGTGQGYWVSAINTTMVEGRGYISRAPTYGSITLDETVFENGIPNNGNVNLNISRGTNAGSDNDDWNLLGNPYPSSISAMAFLTANTNLDGFVNLWTHGIAPLDTEPDPFYENNAGFNYDPDDYIAANGTATTCSPNDNLVCFDGYIASGQSFMVNTIDGAASSTLPISFTNAMRSRDFENSNFFRSSNPETNDNTPSEEEKNRIWLDLASDNTGVDRVVLGYVSNATNQRDRLYDAISSNKEGVQNFYSIIDSKLFVIQGRSLPFTDTDVIPLGFNSVAEDNYTIAINAVDGLFYNQTIFLIDNALGFIHNLTTNPYTFNSEIGEFNNRFEIVFRADALSIDEEDYDLNDFTINELDNDYVKFSTNSALTIETITIFDLLGKRLYHFKGENSTETYLLSNLSDNIYIAEVKLSNGSTVIRKALKF
ncbi:hypothetical protein [Winogradskyella sp.]|uniref:hypothetical protein n=1 Tax=Winogradskyella sp. TaxID=1883156 RepID=UPI0025EAE328|nr:hypothetical protein [Winogradskyella sp.]